MSNRIPTGWVCLRCGGTLPPEGVTVLTKIEDQAGIRNEAKLSRRGRTWLFQNGMTVPYIPTHWKFLP